MNQEAILSPLAALVALTFIVLLQVPYRRFRAAFAGKVTVDDFKLGESATVPEDVRLPNRNLMNLLEMPLLFYVACLAYYVTKRVDGVAVVLAWIYVGLRAAHSLVHLTYNKVVHRLTVFATSNVLLAVLWMRWFLASTHG
jgi:hypothetical protein